MSMKRMQKQMVVACIALTLMLSFANLIYSPAAQAALTPKTTSDKHDKQIIDVLRTRYDNSLAQALVGRSLWYLEYGYMKYGHTKYASTGYIDCSQFVSLVYKDFGYTITSASRKYNTVGVKVEGVYAQRKPGSSTYRLMGVDKLKPGDIFTFWKSDGNGQTHISHVGIYIGTVNGKPCVINTTSGRTTCLGITDSFSYWYGSHLFEVRRVLSDSAYVPGSAVSGRSPTIPSIYRIRPDKPIILPKNLTAGF